VQILRAGLKYLQRLHRVRLAMDDSGMSASEVAQPVRQPIFYRRVAPFTRALDWWPSAALPSPPHCWIPRGGAGL